MGTLGISIDQAQTAAPLFLTVNRSGIGGITGLSPTVALREGSTTNSYLDFNDNTFKTAGWTTKYVSMTEIERGHYQRALDISALPVSENDVLIAEYHVDNSGDVKGDAADLLVVVGSLGDLSLIRKSITNRMEQASGTPGVLELYDDDGTTVLYRWQLRDELGNGIVAIQGAAARRAQGTPGP